MQKWLEIALRELGVCEIRGGENKRIIEYHSTTGLAAKEDEIPWCSSFVNWCMGKAGIDGTDSAAARSWLNWGVVLEEPLEGCVCVIKTRTKGDKATGSASGYHVGFFAGIKDNRIKLLGGNQGDSVKFSTFGLGSYQIVGYRWPKNTDVKEA